jgi:hypothetical protein
MTYPSSSDDQALEELVAELFGPSAATLAAVALRPKSLARLPDSLQQRLATPGYAREIAILRATFEAARKERPQWGEQLQQQIGEADTPPSFDDLQQGDVRAVEGVDLNDPSAEPGQSFTESLLVLLDEPAATHPDSQDSTVVWTGWVVSARPEFAAHWDVLTQGPDVPGSCALTQVWNRVRVAGDHLGPCHYRLNAEQLCQVQAVWLEYLSGTEEPAPEGSEFYPYPAGIRSTPQGAEVVTGRPLLDLDDVRFMAQRLYARAAQAVTAACKAYVLTQGAIELTFADEYSFKLSSRRPFDGAGEPAITLSGVVNQNGKLREMHVCRGNGEVRELADAATDRGERLVEGIPLGDQTDSSWISLAQTTYSANGRMLTLHQTQKMLVGKRVAYQFWAELPRKAEGDHPTWVERVALSPRLYINDLGRAEVGVFILSSSHPQAARMLAQRVAMTLVVETPTSAGELSVKVILKASNR